MFFDKWGDNLTVVSLRLSKKPSAFLDSLQ